MFVKFFLKKPLIPFLCYPLKFSFSANPPSNNSSNDSVSPHPEINKVITQLAPDLASKTHYLHKTNYNFEENKAYTNKVKNSLLNTIERQKLTEKKKNTVDRRKRRVYDKPKFDFDITNYSAWRIYDRVISKPDDDVLKIVCKVPMAPVLLEKVFGRGRPNSRNKMATREWDFEDNDLSTFLLYDRNWKKCMRHDGKPDATVDDFWKSEEPHIFYVNSTRYADHRKFKKWILEQIEQKKNGPSYEEQFIKKYGEIETYEDYDKKYELNLEATWLKYDWSYYCEKDEKPEVNPDYNFTYMPAKVLDEKYRLPKAKFVRFTRLKKAAKIAIKLDDSEETAPEKEAAVAQKEEKQGKQEKKGKPEQQQKGEKGKKQEGKAENVEKGEEKKVKAPKVPKAEKLEKGGKTEKLEKESEKIEKGEKIEKTEQVKGEKQQKKKAKTEDKKEIPEKKNE